MLKIFFRHKLLEFCINVLFGQFEKNFKNLDVNKMKVGNFYRSIELYGSEDPNNRFRRTYQNCRIIRMRQLRYGGEYVPVVTFTAEGFYGPLFTTISSISELRK